MFTKTHRIRAGGTVLEEARKLLLDLQASLPLAFSQLDEEEAVAQREEEKRLEEAAKMDALWRAHQRQSLPRPTFENLPDHILIMVIEHTVGEINYAYQTEMLLPISKLSKRFCSLIYSTPSFWSYIHPLMEPTEIERALSLNKRAGLQFDFGIRVDTDASLSALNVHRERVASLVFRDPTGEVYTRARENLALQKAVFPSLKELQLWGTGDWPDRLLIDFADNWSFPSLRCLDVSSVDLPTQLLGNLTHLSLYYKTTYDPYLVDAVSTLRSAPNLVGLELYNEIEGVADDRLETDLQSVGLLRLKRLDLIYSHYGSVSQAVKWLSWFTRTLKTPSLSSLSVTLWRQNGRVDGSLALEDVDRGFFPSDLDLRNVEEASIRIIGEANLDISDAILRKLPCIKQLKLSLPKYHRILRYIEDHPSLRSLEMRYDPETSLRPAEMRELFDFFRQGEATSPRLSLLTSARGSVEDKLLITRMDEQVGNTHVRWDDLRIA